MAGIEIATAYISIVPDTRKLAAELSSSQFANIGDGAGKSIGSRMSASIGKFAKAGAVAAAAAITGAAAFTLKKGIDRALDIEDAKATLGALGYTVQQVGAITDDVLKSVLGTPYALNDAMGAAVSALAAGVAEGEALTGYLTAVGDAAFVAKVPFTDMAAIFNKVTGVGKVTGEILQQTGERGIPVLQWLADEYGVTADAMRDMVSRGEVDAAMFQQAISSNVGGAALSAGDTTRGAWANMMAALGRTGAQFSEGIIPNIKGGLDGLIGAIDNLGPAAAALGGWVGDLLTDVMEFASSLGSSGGLIPPWVTEQAGALTASLQNLSTNVMPTIKEWYTAYIEPAMTEIKQAFGDMAKEVMPTIKAIVDFVAENWPAIKKAIEPIMVAVVNRISGVMKVISGVIRTVMAVIRGDWGAAWEGIKTTFNGIVDFIKGMPIGQVTHRVFAVVKEIPEWFRQMKDKVVSFLKEMLSKISKPIHDAKNLLDKLNPFHRESPSLVDNVLRGVGLIGDAYSGLSGMAVEGPRIGSVSAGVPGYAAPLVAGAGGSQVFQISGSRQDATFLEAAVRRVLSDSLALSARPGLVD
ncbi:MAG: tape measure protein [Coriobacteriia bacterium]|nr:tape measure protein [Coriobacteriia bacterium]